MIVNRFNYSQRTPILVSNTVSNADEVTRWILDLNGIKYRNKVHCPGLHIASSNKASGQKTGIANNPVFKSTDALTWDKDGFFNYIEPLLSQGRKLLPEDPKEKERAIEMYHYYWDSLWRTVGRYIYTNILPNKKGTLPVVTKGVPWWERWTWTLFYKPMSKAIANGLALDQYTTEELLQEIEKITLEVEALLQDGRSFLIGGQLSIVDIFYATVMAPLILPPEFGGAIARLEQYPEHVQKVVLAFQNRPAGEFILRIFKEHRPPVCSQKSLLKDICFCSKIWRRINHSFVVAPFASWTAHFIQKHFPVIKMGKKVIITRSETVKKALNWDRDFSISEINAAKMKALDMSFFLGMDRGEEHDREIKLMQQVVKYEDLGRIQQYVRNAANDIIAKTDVYEKIDVVSSLVRPVMVRLIADYFGVSSPQESTMMHWLRTQFYDLFLNLSDKKKDHQIALDASKEMKFWILSLIKEQKEKLAKGEVLEDTVLNRLVMKQNEEGNEWITDDVIRRNISGTIIGALETTNKSVVLALEELFRRKDWYEQLSYAAKKGDIETVRGFTKEALRFSPFNPLVMRYAQKDQKISIEGRKRACNIKAGSKLFLILASAMMDSKAFPEPKAFIPNRKAEYMLFGYGYHECLGKHINLLTIPEFVAAIFRLSNARPVKGLLGKGGGLYDGVFPNNYLVEYDFNAF